MQPMSLLKMMNKMVWIINKKKHPFLSFQYIDVVKAPFPFSFPSFAFARWNLARHILHWCWLEQYSWSCKTEENICQCQYIWNTYLSWWGQRPLRFVNAPCPMVKMTFNAYQNIIFTTPLHCKVHLLIPFILLKNMKGTVKTIFYCLYVFVKRTFK